MFDVIKVLKTGFKIFKRDTDNGTFKYFSYPQNLTNDLEIQDNPKIQNLQIQF